MFINQKLTSKLLAMPFRHAFPNLGENPCSFSIFLFHVNCNFSLFPLAYPIFHLLTRRYLDRESRSKENVLIGYFFNFQHTFESGQHRFSIGKQFQFVRNEKFSVFEWKVLYLTALKFFYFIFFVALRYFSRF